MGGPLLGLILRVGVFIERDGPRCASRGQLRGGVSHAPDSIAVVVFRFRAATLTRLAGKIRKYYCRAPNGPRGGPPLYHVV